MAADERGFAAAVDAAVGANPGDPTLRLHLADLLALSGAAPGPPSSGPGAPRIASGDARPITQHDLASALAEIPPSTRLWFESVRNHAFYANESGEHDELVTYLRRHKDT